MALFLVFLFLHIHGGPLPVSGTNQTDHLALLAIKSHLIGDRRGIISSWNDSLHFCQWQGVTCGRRHQRVIALDLSSEGLAGMLSPHVGNMSFLRVIRLQNNSLQGEIPSQVGHLFRLQVLNLNTNSFQGEIPVNLSRCSNLEILRLGQNNLVGKIPPELASLSKLSSLSIHYNNLTGGIPPFVGNLTSLEVLSLYGSHLGGTIPDVFHRLKNLTGVGIGGNDLVGTIPPSVYNLSLLTSFDVGDNQLSGGLPLNLGSRLPRLQLLRLGNNTLTGTLPPTISNCSELSFLDLTTNRFHGKIAINFGGIQDLTRAFLGDNNFGSGEPDEMIFINSLSNCSNLEMLDLAYNQLTGFLPDSLGNLSTSLSYLGLGTNSFYGEPPSSIGSLVGLTTFSLANNQFTGTIPGSIGYLHNLQRLLLWGNNFSGTIPDSMGNLSSLVGLYMHNNLLEGEPSSLGNCHNLLALTLDQNNLSGAIPTQLFSLSSLSIRLNLSNNHFSGPLPPQIGNLRNLNILSIAGNNLSGELPGDLGSCTTLESLELGSNFFQGPIPSSFRTLRGLLDLDLSHNNFSGQIPTFLEQIPLLYLDLSYNNFDGEVPVKGVFANATALSVVGNNDLCGGMPELHLPKCRIQYSKKQRKLSLKLIIAISISSTIVAAAVVSIVLFCFCRKKKKDQPSQPSSLESFEKVSYETLLKATEGFSPANLLGAGSFASVYRGVLDEDEGVIVAVKVLNLQRAGGSKSFIAECKALRCIRHRNLVKVITSCSSVDFQGNDFKAIVYEFMPNGSLDRWLHPTTWTEDVDNKNELHHLGLLHRINIAIDVACALEYLHHGCGNPIVHCDLKPSNILLDQDMVAHVGDFGLAKFLLSEVRSMGNQSSSIGIRGTVGYAAPEYGLGSEVSTRGDVYSFGILLLEMVTGKKPTDPLFQEGLNLHNYARTALADSAIEIVDPLLLHDAEEACLVSMIEIGVSCSTESPQARMDIASVIRELHLVRGKCSSLVTKVVPNLSS